MTEDAVMMKSPELVTLSPSPRKETHHSPLLLPQGQRKHTASIDSSSYGSMDQIAPLQNIHKIDNSHPFAATATTSTPRQICGTISVAIVIASWIAVAEVIQIAQIAYPKPIFLKYITMACFAINLIPALILWKCHSKRRKHVRRNRNTYTTEFSRTLSNPHHREDSISATIRHLRHISTAAGKDKHGKRYLCFSFRATSKFIGGMALTGFLSGILWILSLNQTSVAVNSAIYQSQVAWVFVLSVILFRDPVTVWKSLATALCVGGVAVIGVASGFGSDSRLPGEMNSPVGVIEVVFSTFFYSAFEIISESASKKFVNDDSVISTMADSFYFIGAYGFVVLVCFWIVVPAAHSAGIELFAWPASDDWSLLVIVICLDVVLNTFIIIGITMTSAVYMAMGQLLIIPAGFLVDYMWKGVPVTGTAVAGSVLILVGFCIFQWVGGARSHETEYDECQDMMTSIDVRNQMKSVF